MKWFRDRALTLVSMAMFLLFLVGQVITGFYEYNASQREHSEQMVSMTGYLGGGYAESHDRKQSNM